MELSKLAGAQPRLRFGVHNRASKLQPSRPVSRPCLRQTLTVRAMAGPKNKSPFDEGFGKDLKKAMFGKKEPKPSEVPGADVRWTLNLEFAEAILGAEKDMSYETKIQCEQCKGKGTVPQMAIACSTCKGAGRYRTTKTINVKVPCGVKDGAMIRLKEMGDFGVPPGNLMIRAGVPVSTATIRRDGDDLFSDVAVSQSDLDEGTSVAVTTVEGTTGNLTVPPNTKAGAALRIKGRGAPISVGNLEERGDHYFRLVLKK